MTGFSLNNRRLDYLSAPVEVKESPFNVSKSKSKVSLEDPNDFYFSAFTSTPTYGTPTKSASVKVERIVPPPRKSSYKAGTESESDSAGRIGEKKPKLLDVRPLEIKKRKAAGSKVSHPDIAKPTVEAKVTRPYPSPRSPRGRYHLSAPVSPSPASRRPSHSLAPSPGNIPIGSDDLTWSGSDEEYITDPDSLEAAEGMLVTPPSVVAHSVGSRFLSMSDSDHGMLSPPNSLPHSHSLPVVPTIHRPSQSSVAPSSHSRASTTRSSSDFHLGLGKFYPYDERAAPGPSPPISPSPTSRTFLLDTRTGQISEIRTGKRGASSSTPNSRSEEVELEEEYEEEPMTPSKAGAKAMQMLGSSKPLEKGSQGMFEKVIGGRRKKSEHFRPLPSSVLKEIDLLFGKTLSGTKTSPPRASSRPKKQSTGLTPLGGLGDRKVGEGKIVEIIDENGQVWHDLEEQQEFAWLLSEQGRGGDRYRVVSPVVVPRSGGKGDSGSKASRPHAPARLMDEHVMVISAEEAGRRSRNGGDDDPFGMSNFTSVLNLPKRKKAPFAAGSNGQHGSSPLAFLSMDPYSNTLATAASPPEKRRPAPLTLASGPPPNTKNIIAVQAESGPTLGYGPPPLLRVKERSASTSGVPSTPYVTPRTAPLPPSDIMNKGRASPAAKATNAQLAGRQQHQRTTSSTNIRTDVQHVVLPPMRKGQSFFDTELSPDATQQTFSMSGAKRKASGALNTMLRRVNT